MRHTTRRLTIAIAAGALSLCGAGSALAVTSGAAGGPAGSTPLCTAPNSPLASTPACAASQQPPGHTAAAEATPPPRGDAPGITHPVCEGGSELTGTPACPSK